MLSNIICLQHVQYSKQNYKRGMSINFEILITKFAVCVKCLATFLTWNIFIIKEIMLKILCFVTYFLRIKLFII